MECLQAIKSHWEAAQEALRQTQTRITKETKYKPFEEGDKVWLEGTHLCLLYETMKFAPRRYGPFRVVAKISDVAYKLELPNTWRIHNVFHASLLTPYKETEKHGPNFLEPPPELIDGEPKWEVEQILGNRTYRHKKQFLIRWKGYAPAHDSWVDESDINAPELLTDYKQRTVSKVLSQLTQLAAQSSHQSAQELAQSARPKCQRTTRIRVLESDNEEPFPLPTPLPIYHFQKNNPLFRHSPHPSYALSESYHPYPSNDTPDHLGTSSYPHPTNPRQSHRREHRPYPSNTTPDHPYAVNHLTPTNPRKPCGGERRQQ
jgi:hypothetical protein